MIIGIPDKRAFVCREGFRGLYFMTNNLLKHYYHTRSCETIYTLKHIKR